MAVPPLYKDIGKKSRDLLSKNFPDSFTFEINESQPVSWKLSTFHRASEHFELEASKEVVLPGLNLPTKVTVFTDSFDKIYVDGQVDNFFVPGLKVNVRETYKKSTNQNETKISTEFKRPHVSSTTVFTRASKSSTNTSLVVGADSTKFVGTETEFSLDTNKFNSWAVAAGHSCNSCELTAFGKFSDNRVVTLNWWSNSNALCGCTGPETYLGSEVNLDIGSKAWTAKFGVQRALAPGTSGKVRWDSRNRLALSLITQLRSGVELTLGQELDLSSGNVASVGISLAFK